MSITKEECKNLLKKSMGGDYFKLPEITRKQLINYLYIYKTRKFNEHWEVNEFIGQNDLWDEFNTLHSLNTHASGYQVDGIWPWCFGVICGALDIEDSGGTPLISADDPYKKRTAGRRSRCTAG